MMFPRLKNTPCVQQVVPHKPTAEEGPGEQKRGLVPLRTCGTSAG